MLKSNLIDALRTFTPKEMKELGEFVASPFFNKNKNVKFFDIDDAYALSGIPYDMSAYRSTIDIDDTTNVMYCALAEEYKTLI